MEWNGTGYTQVVEKSADVLQAENAMLERQVSDLRDKLAEAKGAFRRVADALVHEAREREWCSEYDDFVNDLNAVLPVGYDLEKIRQEYEVEVTIELTIRTQVEATSRDEAEEAVREDRNELASSLELSYNDAEIHDWTVTDIEVRD